MLLAHVVLQPPDLRAADVGQPGGAEQHQAALGHLVGEVDAFGVGEVFEGFGEGLVLDAFEQRVEARARCFAAGDGVGDGVAGLEPDGRI